MTIRRIAAILVLTLAGCAANAQTRPASVNVSALLPQHPLYGTLAQYDRQIAALRATLHTPFSNADAQIGNAIASISHDLDRTAAESRAQTQPAPPQRFRDALSLAQTAGGANHARVENDIRQAYRSQQMQLQSAAQQDMAHYRDALLAQQQQSYSTFVDSVNARVQRAEQARAQELREKESALLLELAQQDAPKRLELRTKLQTLTLSDAERARLRSQMHALDAREENAVAAMRKRDAKTLAVYDAQTRSKADADIAKTRTELEARTAANLAARENVLVAQTSGSAPLALPSAPAQKTAAVNMRAEYDALLKATPANPSVFGNAKSDLSKRFGDLRDANDADTQHTRSQIAWLQHDREAVRKRMIAQIMSEAERIAKARGYANVYAASQAPADAVDLTPAVSADLKSLSP